MLPSVVHQDQCNERLDSPILRVMGAQLEKIWERIGPYVERNFKYGKEAEEPQESDLADNDPEAQVRCQEGTEHRQFWRSDRMQLLKAIAPEMYERNCRGGSDGESEGQQLRGLRALSARREIEKPDE